MNSGAPERVSSSCSTSDRTEKELKSKIKLDLLNTAWWGHRNIYNYVHRVSHLVWMSLPGIPYDGVRSLFTLSNVLV